MNDYIIDELRSRIQKLNKLLHGAIKSKDKEMIALYTGRVTELEDFYKWVEDQQQ